MDIRCSREGFKCDGCPIMDKCEQIELTEEINPYVLYEQGRADEKEKIIKEFDNRLDEFCEDCSKCGGHCRLDDLKKLLTK